MAVESAADRLSFVDEDEFAVEATYTAVGGSSSSTVNVIFDNAFLELDVGSQVGAATVQPMIECRSSDLTNGGKQGDTFVIDGVTYKARIIQPDGTGMTKIALEKQ